MRNIPRFNLKYIIIKILEIASYNLTVMAVRRTMNSVGSGRRNIVPNFLVTFLNVATLNKTRFMKGE